MNIPLRYFTSYWIGWFLAASVAILFDIHHLLWPLVLLFGATESLGIFFTVGDAGTLTDTTAKYVPEDFTFIFLGLMFWRLSEWLHGHEWVVFALGAWLIQHFIMHYVKKDESH